MILALFGGESNCAWLVYQFFVGTASASLVLRLSLMYRGLPSAVLQGSILVALIIVNF